MTFTFIMRVFLFYGVRVGGYSSYRGWFFFVRFLASAFLGFLFSVSITQHRRRATRRVALSFVHGSIEI